MTSKETLQFLKVPAIDLPKYSSMNVGEYLQMSYSIRHTLSEYFHPQNARLEKLLSR